MKTVTLSFLFYLLLQGIFLAPAIGIVYYVKPTSPNTTNCTGLPCHSLQYYFENVNKVINNQKNVTMIFMSGTHATPIESVTITAPVINMTGESQGVVLNSSSSGSISFDSFTEVSLSNIMINKSWSIIKAQNANTPLMLSSFTMSSVAIYGDVHVNIAASSRFDSCKFYGVAWDIHVRMDRMNVTMENCTLVSNYLV